MIQHEILVDKAKCIGCGLCVIDCPVNNIELVNKKAHIKSKRCVKCAHCLAVCPVAAVSMTGFSELPYEFDIQPRANPKKLLDAIRARRSIRQFTDKTIPNYVLEDVIEAARWTPTAKNAPSVSFVLIQDRIKEAEALALSLFRTLLPPAKLLSLVSKEIEIQDDFFFKGAPLAISIISKDKISASLAASNMALMAEAHGLGVLYSGYFSFSVNLLPSLRKLLGLSRKDKIVTTLVLGNQRVTYHRTALKRPASIISK